MELYFWLFIISLAAVIAVLVYAITIQRQIKEFQARFKQFFGTKKSPHLNSIVMKNTDNMSQAQKDIEELGQAANNLHKMASRSTQKVGVFFYNPYGDTGGALSFSVAMLNDLGSGVIFSSLHARGGTRVYAKEIVKGKSKQHLTEDEMEAMRRANLE
ncbi:DUF4446 family protein [Patescibacteria group bacterium]